MPCLKRTVKLVLRLAPVISDRKELHASAAIHSDFCIVGSRHLKVTTEDEEGNKLYGYDPEAFKSTTKVHSFDDIDRVCCAGVCPTHNCLLSLVQCEPRDDLARQQLMTKVKGKALTAARADYKGTGFTMVGNGDETPYLVSSPDLLGHLPLWRHIALDVLHVLGLGLFRYVLRLLLQILEKEATRRNGTVDYHQLSSAEGEFEARYVCGNATHYAGRGDGYEVRTVTHAPAQGDGVLQG